MSASSAPGSRSIRNSAPISSRRQLSERTRELRELSEVGIALSTERDHSVLLTMILGKARELSRADAGSLYLLETATARRCCAGRSRRTIRSKSNPSRRRSSRSRAAAWPDAVALTGETLVIDDA